MREMIKKLKKNNNEKKWEKQMEEKNQIRLKTERATEEVIKKLS